MKYIRLAVVAVVLSGPVSVWAGGPRPGTPAPTMGETGLIALGVVLAGAGIKYLRKRP
ncbi:MAG: hypothetical protein HY270_21105 [Deltaproteobacteria bacterium]|nr:hypothetical protein [Deltaproteobacteria bacterium]